MKSACHENNGHSFIRINANARRCKIGHRAAVLSLLATALGMTQLAVASGGPTGGQIVAGAGQIQQNGNVTTIRQDSPTLSLNWQSFNIGANQTVNFLQPGSDAIAVNRIFSNTPSEIDGHLNANGQVWLINPNGILFGQGAQVNVGAWSPPRWTLTTARSVRAIAVSAATARAASSIAAA